MRYEALFAALLILADLSGVARADLAGRPPGEPKFTVVETKTIARNEILDAIVGQDPWLVRQILDLLEARTRRAGSAGFAPPPDGVDPFRNPDLIGAGRTAEGSAEWTDLIKRARAEKEARDKQPPAVDGRSSEGSVELIDMMRRARAAKDAAPGK